MDNHNSQQIHDKIVQIFSELVPDRAERLDFFRDHNAATETIAAALAECTSRSEELAFHLSDFRTDAAFLVALHLFPERFTLEEVSAGVWEFLAHVPYHIKMAMEIADMAFEGAIPAANTVTKIHQRFDDGIRLQTNQPKQGGAPNP